MRSPLDRRILASVQGGYFVLTGVWPLLSRSMFEKVTGPKHDFRLVKTVGVLVAVVGSVLAFAGLRDRVSPEMHLLAQGTAAVFAIVESYYVQQGRISHVHLLEAFAEVLLLAGWAVLPDAGPCAGRGNGRSFRRSRAGRARRRFLAMPR